MNSYETRQDLEARNHAERRWCWTTFYTFSTIVVLIALVCLRPLAAGPDWVELGPDEHSEQGRTAIWKAADGTFRAAEVFELDGMDIIFADPGLVDALDDRFWHYPVRGDEDEEIQPAAAEG